MRNGASINHPMDGLSRLRCKTTWHGKDNPINLIMPLTKSNGSWITDPGKRQKYMQARFDELALLTYPNGSAAGCSIAAKFLARGSDANSEQIVLLIFLKIFNWDDQSDCGHLTNEPAAAASFVDMTIKQFHQFYNGCNSPTANKSPIHPAIAAFREIGQELLRGGYRRVYPSSFNS
jgi:hypothetical protein